MRGDGLQILAATVVPAQCRHVQHPPATYRRLVPATSPNNPSPITPQSPIADPSRVRRVLEAPVIRGVRYGQSGELLLEVTAIKNARGYEVESAETADGVSGPWRNHGVLTNSRKLAISGLTPGKYYRLQVRAIGGSAGHTGWSPSTSSWCM